MRIMYLSRSIEPVLARRRREFPVVLLTGPRQSGKTTLLRRRSSKSDYVSFEAPDVRAAATSDPRGLLAAHGRPLILDEVQHVPGILSYVQEEVDRHRRSKGRFLLTGSQNLLLMERVGQSLAGRAAVLTLLPMSLREQRRAPSARFPWERGSGRGAADPPDELWRRIVRGGYPELVAAPSREASPWLSSYRQTYLERDVRQLRQVGDLTQFDAFMRLLAARSASLLDLTSFSRDLGVAVNTIKAWLSVLEASWQVVIVRPWSGNPGKRLVKSPRVYWLDTGMLCHLLGYTDPRQAMAGPMAGAIFETAVLNELLRGHLHRGESPRIHFWRTSNGREVDFLVETEGRLVPIEAKATSTPLPTHAAEIVALRAAMGDRMLPGYVIHGGDRTLPLAEGVTALPLSLL